MPTDFESGSALLLAALAAVFVSAATIKRLSERFGVPNAVGFIGLGIVLGAVLRSLDSSSSAPFDETFSVLAQLGVVALLFRVGLRSHTSALLNKLPDASLIWIGNVLGSAAIGFVVSRYGLGWPLETSLVVGTAFSATSIAVSLAVWDELGLADSSVGVTLLDVAELDDLSAAVLLAVLMGALPALLNGNEDVWISAGTSSVIVLGKLVAFIVGCYLFAHYLEKRFTGFHRRMGDSRVSLTISILGVGLAIAAIADYLGFSVAIGALFAGLAFSRDPEAVRTDGSFTYFFEFLAPFFFIHIGMQVDLIVLVGAAHIGVALFAAAVISKFVCTYVPALVSMTSRDAVNLSVSMIPRAEIALVVIYECRAIDARIVPEDVFAGMVLVTLATSVFAPIAVRKLLQNERAET